MAVKQMLAQWNEFTASLRAERFVDDQFSQLKQLQDENSPNFVIEVVYLFFEDSQKLIDDMDRALEQNVVDFKQVDDHVHQLKGSSARWLETSCLLSINYTRISHSCIGAARVKSLCVAFRNFCEAKNLEMCVRCLQEVRCECVLLRGKLDYLFTLERNIVEAGGSVPMME